MIILKDLPKPYQPTTRDIVDYFATMGLVEEKENAILLTLAAMNKVSCGVESCSGAGKSVLNDITVSLFRPERVYKLGLTSNTATVYDYEEVNKCDILYVEELQKALNSGNPIMVEVLKNITEGKSISRMVYDAVAKRNFSVKIKGDLGLLYSLALENKVKKDDELDRRVITFMTDISQEQNRKVVQYLAKRRFNKSRLKVQTDETTQQLKEHVNIVLDICKTEVENPFAEYIAKEVPVPFVKIRSYISHYLDLIDSCTKFYFKDRLSSNDKYYTSLQDIYTIHKLYGKSFNRKVHNLPQLGIEIMEQFDKEEVLGMTKNEEKKQQQLFQERDVVSGKKYLSVSMIHSLLKKEGILLKIKLVKDQCDELVEAGFLGKESAAGKLEFYYKTDEVEEFEDKFDFQKCFMYGYQNMKKEFPLLAEDWLKLQMDDKGRIPLFHPITLEKVYLNELPTYEDKLKEREREKHKNDIIITEEVIQDEEEQTKL